MKIETVYSDEFNKAKEDIVSKIYERRTVLIKQINNKDLEKLNYILINDGDIVFYQKQLETLYKNSVPRILIKYSDPI